METCRVITPCGVFTAAWPEDEDQPVQYSGSYDAVSYFRNYLETEPVSGPNGRRLQFGTIEPDELRGFCDAPDRGIVVEQTFDEVEDEDDDGGAVLDSVGDPLAEAQSILEQLNSGEGNRSELSDRLGLLLPQIEFASEDDENAFLEAAALAIGAHGDDD